MDFWVFSFTMIPMWGSICLDQKTLPILQYQLIINVMVAYLPILHRCEVLT